jgi:hypothetical protein
MLKILTLLLFFLFSTSCGKFARIAGTVTGSYSICVDGVSYLQFTSGVSVEYTQDGKIKNCGK